MIKDGSGLSKVGLALLRKNQDKLCPPRQIELKLRGEQQVLVVAGQNDTFESNSFGWGRADGKTKALSEAVAKLGWPLSLEELEKLDPNKDHLIKKW